MNPKHYASVDAFRKHWNAAGVRNMTSVSGQGTPYVHLRPYEIEVDKANRKQGLGTLFMQDLSAFADFKGLQIRINPSDELGATSRGRLDKFYKRFGFLENKPGKNKDYSISERFYRPARSTSIPLSQRFNPNKNSIRNPMNLAWSTPQQRVSSSSTSISYPDPEKKSPVIFTNFKNGLLTIGPINADIGGGKYDQISDWLKSKGITNVVWDRFNRSAEFNSASQAKLQGGKADTATVSNVLNVIPDLASRKAVIATAFDSIKDGGVAYFSTYVAPKAGDVSGRDSFQLGIPTRGYILEIEAVFGAGSVSKIGEVLVASKTSIRNPMKPLMMNPKRETFSVTQKSHWFIVKEALPPDRLGKSRVSYVEVDRFTTREEAEKCASERNLKHPLMNPKRGTYAGGTGYWRKSMGADEQKPASPKPQGESSRESMYVEYLHPLPGENRFTMGGTDFVYVWAKYPDGRRDIGVYAFSGDVTYGYAWFRTYYNLDGQRRTQDAMHPAARAKLNRMDAAIK